ncbi:MAG: hypothetical protein OEU46_00810 [Alphaproteobacteria bacterium]|nr:hypothetical protein [Alphaproteobacteria bacterium]
MILELIEYLTTDCPRPARRLGYLKEAVAIHARRRRLGPVWDDHLERSRAVITDAIARCPRRRTALVIGSGLLLDIPLAELAAGFDRVLLADLVHLRAARRTAAHYGNVELVTADVTGFVGDLEHRVAAGWRGDPVPVSDAFLDVADLDLVVSANVMAQLAIFPAAAMQRRAGLDGDALDTFCRTVVQRHLDYLGRFDAMVCLITERRREAFDRNGGRLTDQDALFGVSLPEGGAEWSWTLAPLGEVNKDYGIRNRVVGYCEFPPLGS